jgi:hypothetical protein
LFLMRNCFAHFREVKRGRQSFGVNTQVSSSLTAAFSQVV